MRIPSATAALSISILCAAIAGTHAANAREVTAQAPSIKIAKPGDGALVALPGDRAVLWGNKGRLQVRSPAGVWGPVVDLSLAIDEIVPDSAGMLVRATRYTDDHEWNHAVLFLGFDGTVIDRWQPDSVWGIASAEGKRWGTGPGVRPPLKDGDQWIDLEKTNRPLADKLFELVNGKVEERGLVELDAWQHMDPTPDQSPGCWTSDPQNP